MDTLSLDLKRKILNYFSLEDLSVFSLVCKTWRDESNDEFFWKNKSYSEYSSPPCDTNNWKEVYKNHHIASKNLEDGFGNVITLETVPVQHNFLDRSGSLRRNKNEILTTVADTIYIWDLNTGSVARKFRFFFDVNAEILLPIDSMGDLIAVSTDTADDSPFAKSFILDKSTGQTLKTYNEKWVNLKLFTPCRNHNKITNSDIFAVVLTAERQLKVYSMHDFQVVAEFQLEGMIFNHLTQLEVNNSHFCVCNAQVPFLYVVTFSNGHIQKIMGDVESGFNAIAISEYSIVAYNQGENSIRCWDIKNYKLRSLHNCVSNVIRGMTLINDILFTVFENFSSWFRINEPQNLYLIQGVSSVSYYTFHSCLAISESQYAILTKKGWGASEYELLIWDMTKELKLPNGKLTGSFAGGYTKDSMKNVITHKPKYRNMSFEELRWKYVQDKLKETVE